MSHYAYSKSQRMRSKQDFDNIYKKSFRFVGAFFLFRLAPHPPQARLGVLISKKFGNSPYRNRLRRLLKEHFRTQAPALPLDVHVSQLRPFFKEAHAKKELTLFFRFLQDRDFLRTALLQKEYSLRDSHLSQKMTIFSRLCFELILIYRRFLSPSLPSSCRFQPSCSLYALDAFRLHGFFKGLILTIRRLLRCQPFCKAGYDPIPKPKKRNKESPH